MTMQLNEQETNIAAAVVQNFHEDANLKQDKIEKFLERLSIEFYKQILQNEDIATRGKICKQLWSVVHNHKNADSALDFFIQIKEPEELLKLIYNRCSDFAPSVTKYYQSIKAIDYDAASFLYKTVDINKFAKAYDAASLLDETLDINKFTKTYLQSLIKTKK